MKLLPRMLSLTALGLTLTVHPAFGQSDQSILLLDPGGHTSVVHQALFTPGGKELISVGEDKVIRVWDTASGEQIGVIHGQIGPGLHDMLFAAALSHDGKTLAVAGNTYEGALSPDPNNTSGNRVYVRVFHLDNLRARPIQAGVTMTLLPSDTSIKTHELPIETLAFSPADDGLLAIGDVQGVVRVWDTRTGKPLWDLDKLSGDDFHAGTVFGVAWSPDGKRLASVSDDKTVHVWDVKSAKVINKQDLGQPVRSVAWSPDGKTIAVGTTAGEIRLLSADGLRKLGSWKQADSVSSLAFRPDGLALASGMEGTDKQFPVTLWSVPDGHKIGAFTRHDGNVTSVAFSDDGSRIASTGGRDNDIYLWSGADPAAAKHLVGSGGEAGDVAWYEKAGADGQPATYKLEWNGSGRAHVFDFRQMQLVPGAYDPAWQSAVTASGGRSLKLGDDELSVSVSGGGKGASFPQQDKANVDSASDYVQTFTFPTKAADTVVVGSRYTLALYRASDGTRLRTFVGHTGPIKSVSVSPDGRYLASASSDQTVAVWPLPKSAFDVDDTPEKPLLQLYAGPGADRASDEFIVWNPEFGYYASSPKGQQLIGWQANNGEDRMADFITGSSAFGSRNNPDAIRLMLEKGSAVDGILAAGATAGKLTVNAPKIKIDEPADGASIADASVPVKVTVTPHDGSPVASVTVSVNNHPRTITFPEDGSAPAGFQKVGQDWVGQIPVRLKAGERNDLSALASGGGDNGLPSQPAQVTVTSTRPASHGLPKLNVLAIGIAKYDRFVWLDYPDADASDIAKTFKSQEGKTFSQVNVTTLTNGQATHDKIEAALKSLADKGQDLDDDDYTIVFIAGHGGNVGQRYYLIPTDVDTSTKEDVARTAVNFSDLTSALQNLPGNVLLLMDACRSGGSGGGVRTGGAADSEVNDGYRHMMDLLQNRSDQHLSPIVSFLSCEPLESSQEGPDWQHGAFTKALLEGLAGAADTNHDGYVDVAELQYYVHQRVIALVAAKQDKTAQTQTPVILGVSLTSQSSGRLSKDANTTAALPDGPREARK